MALPPSLLPSLEVYGFVPGSTSLIVDEQGARPGHGYNLPLPAIAVRGAALHELLPLGGRGYVGLLAKQAGGSLRYSVAVISDGNVRQISRRTGELDRKRLRFPSGQYLAVARAPSDTAAANADGSGSFPNTTEFVDTTTGQTDQEVAVPTSTGVTETFASRRRGPRRRRLPAASRSPTAQRWRRRRGRAAPIRGVRARRWSPHHRARNGRRLRCRPATPGSAM
jgi:hypothetical protein